MDVRKFWNFQNTGPDQGRVLHLRGTIAEETWFEDEVSPAMFATELGSGKGPLTVWINSPGGDCFAAAQIYNMLMDYPYPVRVNIDGIAASAASVIAMAGDEVFMSPVSMMMIHNPATLAIGDRHELSKTIEMLDAVKDSIVNAYEIKTSMSRVRLAHLMDSETWMDATKAIEFGFADAMLTASPPTAVEEADGSGDEPVLVAANAKPHLSGGVLFSRKNSEMALFNRLSQQTKPDPAVVQGRRIVDLLSVLSTLEH